VKELENSKPGMFKAKQVDVDPKEFAEMLGIPYSSLQMLLREHHERDPLVK
jgi:predicted transcriptional regulator